MQKAAIWKGVGIALALCTLGISGLAQTEDGGEPEGGTPRQRLAIALGRLKAVEPRMDAETRRYLPVYRAILERIYLDRDSVTESEMALARNVLFATRAPDLLAKIKAETQEMPGGPDSSLRPQVIAGRRRAPGGKSIGFVLLKVGSTERTMAEIPVRSGGLTVEQRASRVAQRIRASYTANPLWWTRLSVGNRRGSAVVLSPDAPDGIVITADVNFARERGMVPSDLANSLSRNIRTSFDRLATARALTAPELRVAQRAESVDLREQGDRAYDRGDLPGAETAYRAAIEKDPGYPIAYLRLGALYKEQGKVAAGRDLLNKAIELPDADAQLRKEARDLLR